MPLRPEARAEMVRAWNACHGAFYRVRREWLDWCLDQQNWISYSLADAGGSSVLVARAADSGIAAGISRKTLWVPLPMAEAQNCERWAEDLVAHARGAGLTRLALGGDEFQFFPGVPADGGGALGEAFLRANGFQLADCADYAGPILTEPVQRYVAEAVRLASEEGWRLTPVAAHEKASLGEFLQANFPGRWEREYRFGLTQAQGLATWLALQDRDGGILGFARAAIRGSEAGQWLPGALRTPLVEGGGARHTDACLGPIGLVPALRGRGAGRALLGLTLQFLLSHGAEQLCIDWTNAYNYYKPLALPVVRKYWTAWRDF